jgi:hypothetical protein
MQATQTSPNQPRISYAYDAVQICAGKEELRQVVYRGFQDGRPVVDDGASEFYATRTSEQDEEPAFKFDVADKLQQSVR